MKSLLVATVAGMLALPAFADPTVYNYTDQGVGFQLTVEDLGGTVTADLKITSDGTDEFLKYAGFKLFNQPTAFANGVQTVTPIAGYVFIAGARSGGGLGNINSVNSGFVGSDHTGTGPAMGPAGTEFNFSYEWNTNVDPLDNPSLKMFTWTFNPKKGLTKSRQWSSGELDPSAPPPGGGVPEPASLVLLAIGAIYLARRMRG